MKKFFLALLGVFVFVSAIGETIDTLYLDLDGKVVRKTYATYTRAITVGQDANGLCLFEDKKIEGGIVAKGTMIKTAVGYKYEGSVTRHFDDGKLQAFYNYKNGKLDGKQLEYDTLGNETTKYYIDGKIQGDSYVTLSTYGIETKYSTATNKVIWMSPDSADLHKEKNGDVTWLYYTTNNLLIDATISDIDEYGRWYRVDLSFYNGTRDDIDFDPERLFNCTVNGAWRKVWGYDDYMKKVDDRQSWERLLADIDAHLDAATDNKTYSSTTTFNGKSKHTEKHVEESNDAEDEERIEAKRQRVADLRAEHSSSLAAAGRSYLRKMKLYPEQTIRGFVMVERKRKGDKKIEFTVDVNGAKYPFYFK